MVAGRPQKYDSFLRPMTVHVPASLYDTITEDAKSCDCSRNEYVVNLLYSSDKKFADTYIKYIKTLETQLKEQRETIGRYSDTLDKSMAMAKDPDTLFKEIKYNPLIKEFISNNTRDVGMICSRNLDNIVKALDLVLFEFEKYIMREKGLGISNKIAVKNQIKSTLIRKGMLE